MSFFEFFMFELWQSTKTTAGNQQQSCSSFVERFPEGRLLTNFVTCSMVHDASMWFFFCSFRFWNSGRKWGTVFR